MLSGGVLLQGAPLPVPMALRAMTSGGSTFLASLAVRRLETSSAA